MWERGLKHLLLYVIFFNAWSLPMWERGLKQILRCGRCGGCRVAPHVGAWIETNPTDYCRYGSASLPMWERGLKRMMTEGKWRDITSLPMWERGLKPPDSVCEVLASVAPHVGAWIETREFCSRAPCQMSLPMWERGLKQ